MAASTMLEHVLQIEGLTKTFGRLTVVNDLSFDVKRGEMFGFLGPNGSGKTTTIRMALRIIRPDVGAVSILGSAPDRSVLKGVGYLPEERGLPREIRVLDAIRYLGRLKGLTFTEAEDRGTELLRRVNLYEHRSKKVEDLSRGMTQLVQFVAAIVHDPEFIVLDEPFAGLDPLNVELIKEMLSERQRAGATIMFSTHIMSDVEELCERVALIAEGRLLLLGDLAEIKRERGANSVQVQAGRIPDDLADGQKEIPRNGVVEYAIEAGRAPETILRSYLDAGIEIERFELSLPSLNDIFIEEVSRASSVS
ncbi:MAG: ATP-binding cassette domain-containing protein [Chloroflexota bacterium]|jgi:ABC-2 type transport system ATP-binding protein|nr:ATP-binding cassette domain-containing protein [Chloroflexota bacterium]